MCTDYREVRVRARAQLSMLDQPQFNHAGSTYARWKSTVRPFIRPMQRIRLTNCTKESHDSQLDVSRSFDNVCSRSPRRGAGLGPWRYERDHLITAVTAGPSSVESRASIWRTICFYYALTINKRGKYCSAKGAGGALQQGMRVSAICTAKLHSVISESHATKRGANMQQ